MPYENEVTSAAAPTMAVAVAPAHHQVGVFWDIENCRVPSGRSALELVKRFRKFFLTESAKEAEFMCVCDTSKEDKEIVDDLYNAEVLVIYAPATNKNAADDKLRELMRRFAETHTEPATVVLISGDVNFRAVLSDVQHRYKHKVILVHPDAIHDSLRTCVEDLIPFSHFIKDLPAKPTANPVGGDHILEVQGLPSNREKKQVETRLLQLSENSGRCKVNILGKTAHLRFSSPASASRAKVRMEGEDVFGSKITVRVVPNDAHTTANECSPRESVCHSGSPRRHRNRRKKKPLTNKVTPDGTPNQPRGSPLHEKFLVRGNSAPSPPLEPFEYSSDGTTGSPRNSPLHLRQIPGSQGSPPLSRYSTPSPPTLRGALSKRPASPHILYSQLRERSHSPYRALWTDVSSDRVGPSTGGQEQCGLTSDGLRRAQIKRMENITPDQSVWRQRLRHHSGDLQSVRSYGSATCMQTRHLSPQHQASVSRAQGHNSPVSRRRSRSWSSYSNRVTCCETPGKAAQRTSPCTPGSLSTEAEQSASLVVSNLDGSFTAAKWVEVLQDQLYRQDIQVLGVKTETLLDGSVIGHVQVPNKEEAKKAISSLHRKKIRKKRIHICIKQKNDKTDAKSKVIAILSEVSCGCLPLLEFMELYEEKYADQISMSELTQMEDAVKMEELADRQRVITAVNMATNNHTNREHSQNLETKPDCGADICPPGGSLYHPDVPLGGVAGGHHLPMIAVPWKTFAAQVHTMLQQHHGEVPLQGFLTCYKEEFGRGTKNTGGMVPVEHILKSVPGIKVRESRSGVKDVVWLGGDSAEIKSDDLERFSAHQISKIFKDFVSLLERSPGRLVTVSELSDMYQHRFGTPFRAEDYGGENLLDVLKAIPDSVQVLGSDGCHSAMLSHQILSGRFRSDLLQVIQGQPNDRISLADLPEVFGEVMGKPFDVADYGVCCLQDLLTELPKTTVLVPHKDGRRWILHLLKAHIVLVLSSLLDHQLPLAEFLCAFARCTGYSLSLNEYHVSSVRDLMAHLADLVVVKFESGDEVICLVNSSQKWQEHWCLKVLIDGPCAGLDVAQICDIYQRVYSKTISASQVWEYSQQMPRDMSECKIKPLAAPPFVSTVPSYTMELKNITVNGTDKDPAMNTSVWEKTSRGVNSVSRPRPHVIAPGSLTGAFCNGELATSPCMWGYQADSQQINGHQPPGVNNRNRDLPDPLVTPSGGGVHDVPVAPSGMTCDHNRPVLAGSSDNSPVNTRMTQEGGDTETYPPSSGHRSKVGWEPSQSRSSGPSSPQRKADVEDPRSRTTSESSCSSLGSPGHRQGTPNLLRHSRLAARFSNPVDPASPTPSDISI